MTRRRAHRPPLRGPRPATGRIDLPARFVRHVREHLHPKLADTEVVCSIWSGGTDVKLAVEMSAAILMDRPIIVCVAPATSVPDKRARVADTIVEFDGRNRS